MTVSLKAVESIATGEDWKRMLEVVSSSITTASTTTRWNHSIGPPASASISCGGSAFGRKPVSSVSVRARDHANWSLRL